MYRLSTGLMPEPPDLSAECFTLLISALMMPGIKGISPVFLLVKSMADRLRESETLFRSLADTTSAALVIYKGNQFQYVNHAAQHICGCSTEDINVVELGRMVGRALCPLEKAADSICQISGLTVKIFSCTYRKGPDDACSPMSCSIDLDTHPYGSFPFCKLGAVHKRKAFVYSRNCQTL